MRTHELVGLLAPLVGLQLVGIEDGDRQARMDDTLNVIRGWTLHQVSHGRLPSGDHPQGMTNVHLVFRDGGMAPEFRLGLRAREVHRVSVVDLGERQRRAEILFKRGHQVALDMAGDR